MVSLDGTALKLADTQANAVAFDGPSSGRGANTTAALQLQLLGLVVLFRAAMAHYATVEATLARTVLSALEPGMLGLVDRCFPGFDL